MTSGDPQPAEHRGATGERVELARYTVSAGERIIYGHASSASCASSMSPAAATAADT